MILGVVSTLLFVSAVSKAVQDKLQFHFDKSVFSRAKNKMWWNPKISHINKYEWSSNKFIAWCLKTWLVLITDAWHFFGFLRDFSLFTALVISFNNYYLFLFYPVYRLVFHIFFTYIFKKWQK